MSQGDNIAVKPNLKPVVDAGDSRPAPLEPQETNVVVTPNRTCVVVRNVQHHTLSLSKQTVSKSGFTISKFKKNLKKDGT